ncbi:recombinase family protein [Sneathiella aquimaris]|uniref:recombinase family protein n=1 Tax=Sneathiella aquimaris TaxID=2599305 RepID=UPI00146DAC73|nr:recombinase family protein [Sneathiella aquimaris]
MVNYVTYYRVSTDRQGKSGLGLAAQQKAVSEFIGDLEPLQEFVEVESGKKADRPELLTAMALCKKKKARLVIAKLDRLSRNVAFIANLMDSGVDFVACDMPEANKLTIHILAAVAEHEREMISQRTKVALQAAKAKGVKLGSPNPEKGSKIGVVQLTKNADRFASNVAPVIREIQTAGVNTYRGIAQALNARGIHTARGGEWHPATVRNVLERTK